MTTPTTQTPQSAPVPGELFGYPGQTVPLFSPDSAAQGLAFNYSATGAQVIPGVQAMQKTDVVTGWTIGMDITQSVAVGTGVLPSVSPNSVYHTLQNIELNAGTGFTLVNVATGTDLDAINRMHPMVKPRVAPNDKRAVNTNYSNALIGQAATTDAGVNGMLYLDLPASIVFDSYIDISPQGTPMSNGYKAIVSPQFMSGARVMQAQLTTAPIVGSNGENSPLYGSTTGLVMSGSGSLTLYRRGYYGSNQLFLPTIKSWQRQIKSMIVPIGSGVDVPPIPLPQIGQIGGAVVRLVDPGAANSIGPSISQAKLSISSGFTLFNSKDIDLLSYINFLNQDEINGAGTNQVQFDLWTDEFGQLTNRYSVNTITTTNAIIDLVLASSGSSSTYAVITYDALVPQTLSPLN